MNLSIQNWRNPLTNIKSRIIANIAEANSWIQIKDLGKSLVAIRYILENAGKGVFRIEEMEYIPGENCKNYGSEFFALKNILIKEIAHSRAVNEIVPLIRAYVNLWNIYFNETIAQYEVTRQRVEDFHGKGWLVPDNDFVVHRDYLVRRMVCMANSFDPDLS